MNEISPKPTTVAQLVDKNMQALNLTSFEEAINSLPVADRKRLSNPSCSEFIRIIFGSSPYLSQLIIRHPALVGDMWHGQPEQCLPEIPAALPQSQDEMMRMLRHKREQALLVTALADMSGKWDGATATTHWSRFADAAVNAALLWGIERLHERSFLTHADAASSGIFVLGMGKLGATELNYSSDIDLILFYDPALLPLSDADNGLSPLLKQIQQMIYMLETRTADGYVFRTDVRLRPDPFSTPVIMSVPAGISYYESVGQNWERAAYIRARVIAGDISAGESFLKELRPFIWRKHLDFAAIADIQSIKRQIDSNHSALSESLCGHDIKLGTGGIRDIELFTHTLQLIWGGKKPSLRLHTTCAALAELAEQDIIPRHHAEILEQSYWRLRHIEHAIQLINDEHTHSLPEDESGMRAVACLLGYDDLTLFVSETHKLLEEVSAISRPLFEENKPLSSGRSSLPEQQRASLVFTGNEDDPETTATLSRLGYAEPQMISRCIRQWHSGTCRATRSAKAREILTEIIPDIIDCFAATPEPDQAFKQLDRFFYSLPAGVQTLSTLAANPDLIPLLADIFGSSPLMSELLCDYPHVIDRFIASGRQAESFDAKDLNHEIKSMLPLARDSEDKLHMLRQLDNEYQFLVAAKLLTGGYNPAMAAESFTHIADALTSSVLDLVSSEMATQNGKPQQGEVAILALGKWGNGNLSLDSDLDFMLIYRSAGQGKCKLTPSVYYNRFATRLVNAISARMKFGKLYNVDMRLRPFGNDGSLATIFSGLEQYYREQAWSYELMALTNARCICGSDALKRDIDKITSSLLKSPPRDSKKIISDAAELIMKTRRELPPSSQWDIKRQQGGLLELEMAAQALKLCGQKPSDEHNSLIELYLSIQQLLRICVRDAANMPALTKHIKRRLNEVIGGDEQEALASAFKRGYEIVHNVLGSGLIKL